MMAITTSNSISVNAEFRLGFPVDDAHRAAGRWNGPEGEMEGVTPATGKQAAKARGRAGGAMAHRCTMSVLSGVPANPWEASERPVS